MYRMWMSVVHFRLVPAALVIVGLLGACNSSNEEDAPATAGASSSDTSTPVVPRDGEVPSVSGSGDQPAGRSNDNGAAGAQSAAPAPPAAGQPGGGPGAPGEAPPGRTRVISGSRDDVTWTLDVWREAKDVCLGFLSGTSTNGGGGGEACSHKPPIGVSLARAVYGRFAFGLTSDRIVQVRFEHVEGATGTLATVAGPAGFGERFYAGPIAQGPFKRIVGLDSAGKVVAEYDVKKLNTTSA